MAPYPVVKDLRVSTQFPHGMRIHVIEQLPVGAIVAGGADDRRQPPTARCCTTCPTAVAADDPAARRCRADRTSPTRRRWARWRCSRRRRSGSRRGSARSRPPRRTAWSCSFARARHLLRRHRRDCGAKWVAATAVLAAPGSAGAAYIDVTDPERPAAGVSSQALAAAGSPRPARRRRSGSPGAAASQASTAPRTLRASTAPGTDPNPQVELERSKFRNSLALVESWAICNGACVRAVIVDFPQLQGITCETPATSD